MKINVPPPSFKWKVRDDGIMTWNGGGEGDHDYVIGSYISVFYQVGVSPSLSRNFETICTALARTGEGKVYGNLRNSKVLGLARPSPLGLPVDVFAFVYTEN